MTELVCFGLGLDAAMQKFDWLLFLYVQQPSKRLVFVAMKPTFSFTSNAAEVFGSGCSRGTTTLARCMNGNVELAALRCLLSAGAGQPRTPHRVAARGQHAVPTGRDCVLQGHRELTIVEAARTAVAGQGPRRTPATSSWRPGLIRLPQRGLVLSPLSLLPSTCADRRE